MWMRLSGVGEWVSCFFYYYSIISHGHGQGGDSMIKQKKLSEDG